MANERYICFLLAGQEFGLPIREVKETIARRPITRLVLVPDFIAGLINLRGEVLAVLDLGRLLGIGRRAAGDPLDAPAAARVVVLRGRGAGRPASAGLLVDEVTEVRDLAPGALRPVPATVPAEAAAFLRGLARVEAEGSVGSRRADEGAALSRGDDTPARPIDRPIPAASPLLVLDLDRIFDCDRLKPFRRRA